MATRRERFLKHRARFVKRNQKYLRHKYRRRTYDATHPASHNGGQFWLYGGTGEKMNGDFPRPVYAPGDWTYGPVGGLFSIIKPYAKTPPYAKFNDPLLQEPGNVHGHAKLPLIGFHKRRVTNRGHKAFRMDGRTRQITGAFFRAMVSGAYPTWDPLQRHPTALDIANGADPANIPDWRWGVTGVPPAP